MWGLVFGTIQVIIPRLQNLPQTESKESQWAFSQLVPVILLVQPLGKLTEHMFVREPRKEVHQSENKTSRDAKRKREHTCTRVVTS
jgi:hypothetical protein